MVQGIEHFRTPVAKGIEIMELLRGHTSGLAVPTYVIDAPGGGGKVPVLPQYILSQSTDKIILRNYEGVICYYREPDDRTTACKQCGECRDKVISLNGLAGLFNEQRISLVPKGNMREKRRKGYGETEKETSESKVKIVKDSLTNFHLNGKILKQNLKVK